MRHLLQVLIQSLARFFRGCADVLAALGSTAGPAAGHLPGAAAFPCPAAGPPEDWVERANPPAPAHWLEVVKQRAPGFLNRDSRREDPWAGAVQPLAERAAASELSPRLSVPEHASANLARSSGAVGPEQGSLPVREADSESARVSKTLLRKAPRSVHIVTVVEECPRRKPAEVRTQAPEVGNPELRESFPKERPLRNLPPGRVPKSGVPSLRDPVASPRPPSESVRSFAGRTQDADRENTWQALLRPASATPAVPSVPGSGVTPALEGSEGIRRLPQPEDRALEPEFWKQERSEPAPFPRGSTARWPELPASAESDDLEDARLLYRELRRQAVLEEEQRGIPWSA